MHGNTAHAPFGCLLAVFPCGLARGKDPAAQCLSPVASPSRSKTTVSENTTRSGTENRQRRHLIQVRVDDDERAAIEAKAERAGLSVGALMRHLGTGRAGPRAVRQVPLDRRVLAYVLAQLGRYGSNVNQLARVANESGSVEASAMLAEIRDNNRDMHRVLMEAAGRG